LNPGTYEYEAGVLTTLEEIVVLGGVVVNVLDI
jgi:hypothetical protein